MADVPMSIAAIANALKYFYLEGLRSQINEASSVFAAQIERSSRRVEGYKIRMALGYGRTGGIGNRSDVGTLPTVNPRKFLQAETETLNIFANIQVSDKAIEASRSSKGSFIQALSFDMEKAEVDAKTDWSRQVHGDGTGLLGVITAVSSVSTTRTLTLTNAFEVQKFAEGMLVDLYNYGDGDGATKDTSEAEITIVDMDTNKVTLVASHTPVVGDKLYLAGNKDGELTGIEKVMTANNTLYGVVRATYPWFNPIVKTIGGEISEINIQAGLDDAEIRTGSKVDLLLGSYGVRRAYQTLLSAQKSNVNIMDLKGGYKAISYNGTALVADRFVPASTMYGFSMKHWEVAEMDDWDWLDKDGGILTRVSNKPIWQATIRKYADLICDLPGGQVKFATIQEH